MTGGHGRFLELRGLRTHYLDVPGGDPPIVLLHGLSANAYEFDGLLSAGLSPAFRVVAPDLRGRGRSGKPPTGYRMHDHAGDVLELLDALDLDRVVLGGHSFGAYLSIYLAAHHPERVTKLIVIDAALSLHPRVGEMLKPSLDRLTQVSPSAESYLAALRDAPYMAGRWDDSLERYFRAEMVENADGSVRSATSASAIAQALVAVRSEPWGELVRRVEQPALLLNALGAYGPEGTPPLIEEASARETASTFANCRYVEVPGNHLTMVFMEGAAAIRREIEAFIADGNGVGPSR